MTPEQRAAGVMRYLEAYRRQPEDFARYIADAIREAEQMEREAIASLVETFDCIIKLPAFGPSAHDQWKANLAAAIRGKK